MQSSLASSNLACLRDFLAVSLASTARPAACYGQGPPQKSKYEWKILSSYVNRKVE
jgi:hypothetical protein